MAYATFNKPSLYFNTKLYTGTGSAQSITGVGFQPDWVWGKNRSTTNYHDLEDSSRGVTKRLSTNASDVEATETVNFTAFDSDGFTVGTGANVNGNGNNIVVWNWRANAGTTSSNSDGSITSTVQVNTNAGFSIVQWSGTTNATVGHGLGVKPDMVITKSRDNATNWATWHKNLTGGDEEDRYVNLNTNAADDTYTNYWGTGGFTSSVFGVSNNAFHNNVGNMVAYCFASKKGYSKFGGYTGNENVDGTFVYTGFKPAWILFKKVGGSSNANWQLWDNKRDPFNPVEKALHPDITNTASADQDIDILSNGFKLRSSASHLNANGVAFIYMAFAEEPIVANVGQGIPATAR